MARFGVGASSIPSAALERARAVEANSSPLFRVTDDARYSLMLEDDPVWPVLRPAQAAAPTLSLTAPRLLTLRAAITDISCGIPLTFSCGSTPATRTPFYSSGGWGPPGLGVRVGSIQAGGTNQGRPSRMWISHWS